MVQIDRVRVGLTGFSGAPGINTFYALNGPSLVAPLHALYDSIRGQMPLNVQIQVETVGDRIESSTGALVGSWATVAQTPLAGTGPEPYPAPCGFALTWVTNGIVHSHHVRGRTFVVPAAGSVYQADGSIAAANLASIGAALSTFLAAASPNFVIWSRPFLGTPATPTSPASPARAGTVWEVVGATAKDKAVVLRSRRD